MTRKYALLFIPFIFILSQCRTAPNADRSLAKYTGTIGDSVMVSSAHPQASKAGIDILKQGGNAVDAAIAIQYALAVVYPRAGNLGGGGFMVYRDAKGAFKTLDFRETAPAKADRDMYLDDEGNAVSDWSRFGGLSVGIPGTVGGIFESHKELGLLDMSVLIQPAIDLAENGFQLLPAQARLLNEKREDIEKYSPPNCIFLQKEKWHAGDIIIQKELAATLKRIQKDGLEGFYSGETARLLVEQVNKTNGIISLDDLQNYKAKWRAPLKGTFREYDIYSMGPPSSGGIVLLQILGMIEDQPLKNYGFNSLPYVHTLVEAERRAYADRSEYLGDPDFWDVPSNELLNEAYLQKRMENFDPAKASISDNIKPGKLLNESEETTHLSVVDLEGNAVSITTTLNANYGSKVWVDGAGFFLNNEMDDFSAKPGVPNLYGLIGNEANAIEPGKRMLSSMTPTIIEKNDALFMVTGTPGGSTIITSVLQSFLNVAEFEMSMAEAVNAYRFHHQWYPDTIKTDSNAFKGDFIEELNRMGHAHAEREPIGRVDAILVRPDGNLEGASDFRGEGAALGY